MIHLYAVCDGACELGGLLGVDDEPLSTVAADGGLLAVVSEHPRRPVATRARALRHFEVVAEVGRRAAALPVRYGAVYDGAEALRATLATEASDLRRRLQQVAGCVEILVRMPAEPAPPGNLQRPTAGVASATRDAGRDLEASGAPAPGAGRAYLEARRQAEARAAGERLATIESLRQRTQHLDDRCADVVERDGPGGPERCLLVTSDEATAVLAAARAAAEPGEGREGLVVGGPWPPYTFA